VTRRTLILLVAGLLAAVGCLPIEPPAPARPTQVCGVDFSSANAYQNSFGALTRGNTGWITADAFVATSLPDGRTAWWMADTMVGSETDNSAPDAGVVHNSAVLQSNGCLAPRLEPITPPNGRWSWPGSTIVENDTMLVFVWVVGPGSGDPGFDFTIFGTAVARYHLPDLQLLGVTNLPVQDAPQQPYGGGAIPWGIRSVDADGTVYLYGTTKRSGLGPADIWVARAPFVQVTDPSAWQYFTALPAPLDWSNQFSAAEPMSFPVAPDAAAPLAQMSVARYGDKYLASAVSDVLDSRVRAWISTDPEGPWQYLGVVATAQLRSGQYAYDARTVKLPGAGWTVVYNVNDPNHNRQDVTLYRGQFAPPNGGVLPPAP
jgi:hypothetical protein